MPVPRAAALEDWLIDLTKATADVARQALARADAGVVVRQGAYGVPTVAADAEAERVIIEAVKDAPIPLNLFSEEVGVIQTPGADYTLVADPIDGTRNAVRGIPFFCVSLAIGKTGLRDMEIGVVRNAITNDVYQARRKGGARLNGASIKVRPFNPSEVIVAAALDYERELRIQWHPYVHFRDMGSAALELCLVATGGLDLFLSTKSYLRIVDIAAAALIVEEAGGAVLDLQKKPLNAGFDLKERLAMVALGDLRAWEVLA